METLIELLKKALADTFALYLKAHNYHWNIEGQNFVQLHGFFGDLYEELHDAIDPLAEHIRTLDSYVPGSFKRFSELTDIEDELSVPDSREMCRRILDDNNKLIKTLMMISKLSENFGKYGIQNFIQDRIDIHEKHSWMLRSIIK